jgi:hypothetical protein
MPDGKPITQSSAPKAKRPWKRESFALRQAAAREWLERLVPAERITEARVNELAGVVDRYRPGSKYQLIADAMVKNNEIPTLEKVAARHQSRKEARLRRNVASAPVDLTESVVDRLLGMIGQSWKDRGRGPFWGEVAAGMGWDRRQAHDVLFRLRTDGAVVFTVESGSLTAAHGDAEATKIRADRSAS